MLAFSIEFSLSFVYLFVENTNHVYRRKKKLFLHLHAF